ncbi:CGNR zinc finger domain-containing protein [Virgisporangium aurantiacum]|uniref:PadR family transcriptional regulator n=1 Tax=Virgisporangium aurantiacum TaxID=175570 RepID=A0A8J3Z982_9ACTN|nr:CGNR zinc finger domain-containing protein [Virgisporangium aurantiacum]GIJ57570.1 PadR family transcriptional regulator [Virgisporangium aurantiacum]
MVNGGRAAAQEAPGALERVRELLNTWLVPNDTRQPTDAFAGYATRHGLTRAERSELRELRDDLRGAVERADDGDDRLNGWLRRSDLRPEIENGTLVFRHAPGPAAELVAAVVAAVDDGRWPRLKACPDCRWVFYDHTRNGGKRWCLMTAGGPDGRSCGTIAKVRSHRQRQAAQPF